MTNIFVAAGSSLEGVDEHLKSVAYHTGRKIAESGATLIIGDAKCNGLMDFVAQGALEASSGPKQRVIEINTQEFLEERKENGTTTPKGVKTIRMKDLHERTAALLNKADHMIALPGNHGVKAELQNAIMEAGIKETGHIIALNHSGMFDYLQGTDLPHRVQIIEPLMDAVGTARLLVSKTQFQEVRICGTEETITDDTPPTLWGRDKEEPEKPKPMVRNWLGKLPAKDKTRGS